MTTQVEGQLSKVPAHRFMEESEYFTSHFIAGNPPDALVAIHSVTANGFRTLLELLYPRYLPIRLPRLVSFRLIMISNG